MRSVELHRCPPASSPEEDRLVWANEAVKAGEAFLESQPAWMEIAPAMERLSDALSGGSPAGQSDTKINFMRRDARETVAQRSNLNPRCGNFTCERGDYERPTETLNKVFQAWWPSVFADRKLKQALQYSTASAGYLMPWWNPHYWSLDRGEIDLTPLGAADVLPLMPPKDGDLQRAYAVAIRIETPLSEAIAQFPAHSHRLKADRGQPSWARRTLERAQNFLAPVLNLFGPGAEQKQQALYPTVDIFYIYVRDSSINETGKEVSVGEPGTSWHYTVPSLGSEIDTRTRDALGNPIFRKATREDCRLYPTRRLIISTRTFIIRDGPSPWWHGRVPLVKFDHYRWPWEFLGQPMTKDGRAVEDAYNQILRGVIDAINVRLDPPLAFDDKAHSRDLMRTINMRRPGERLEMDLTLGTTVKPLLPPEFYDVPPQVFQILQLLPDLIHRMNGLQDMEAFAKAGQIPSGDTVEKIFQLAGPLLTDQARDMERGLFELAQMLKDLFFQFYTTPKRFQMLGEDGLSAEDFDFEPGHLIPDHLPGEDFSRPSQYSPLERARRFSQMFTFAITPGSSYKITDMQRQLLDLQMWRDGRFPVDPQTVAESVKIPNFGKIEGATVLERWKNWQAMMAELQSALMVKQAETQMAIQQQALGGLLGSLAPGAGGDDRGRPPSGGKPPHIEQKQDAGGPRSIISES